MFSQMTQIRVIVLTSFLHLCAVVTAKINETYNSFLGRVSSLQKNTRIILKL